MTNSNSQRSTVDEFGNRHFRTGIPMNGFSCAHVKCPEWHLLTNDLGRAEIYGSGDGVPGVAVLFDSLDNTPPSPQAERIMAKLTELRDAINDVLDAALKAAKEQSNEINNRSRL